ncbi:sigma-70 family RNA polymerase sigma factor [Nonomuraea sp. NPDC050310]|uniref:RNA polymerase sigma factor n=1 Tax=Nonomuraea sp. NPDC050310 TaxID=3154935 RepID=UPI003402909C
MADSALSPELADKVETLYRLYASRVTALAYRQTRNHAVADDVAGEAWLRVVRWVHTLRAENDQAWGWLSAIVRHAALDYYRPKRSTERVTDWSQSENALPAAESAEDTFLERLELATVVRQLQGCGETAMAKALYEAAAA